MGSSWALPDNNQLYLHHFLLQKRSMYFNNICTWVQNSLKMWTHTRTQECYHFINQKVCCFLSLLCANNEPWGNGKCRASRYSPKHTILWSGRYLYSLDWSTNGTPLLESPLSECLGYLSLSFIQVIHVFNKISTSIQVAPKACWYLHSPYRSINGSPSLKSPLSECLGLTNTIFWAPLGNHLEKSEE